MAWAVRRWCATVLPYATYMYMLLPLTAHTLALCRVMSSGSPRPKAHDAMLNSANVSTPRLHTGQIIGRSEHA